MVEWEDEDDVGGRGGFLWLVLIALVAVAVVSTLVVLGR